MKILRENIKDKRFKRCYLLYGEERYLCRYYKNQLKQAITDGDDMNYSYYDGKGINTGEVIDTGETLPFFAERRLIVIEDSGLFKSGCDDKFLEYVRNIPEYLTIVFVEKEVDARNRLYKAVSQNGYVSEMKPQGEADLKTWVTKILASQNRQIDGRTMQLLLEYAGSSMDNIYSEVEKLISYTMGRNEITKEDVEAICTVTTENKIFDMVSCVALKKQKEALELYYDLLTLRESPMRILFQISKLFSNILEVKELEKDGYSVASIARKMGKKEFVINKLKAQGTNFSNKVLREALEECASLEEDYKRGRLDEKLVVEMIIIKYSRRQEQ
ncbi:MAG: DNA polymerase III subunit delta [Lachnospiraceae bacterium]